MNDSNYENSIHNRIRSAAGSLSFRELGEITGTHPETVRRYMSGQTPSALFLANLCHKQGISGEWLLTGRGPMLAQDIPIHSLKNIDAHTLLDTLSTMFIATIKRVDDISPADHTTENYHLHIKQTSWPTHG